MNMGNKDSKKSNCKKSGDGKLKIEKNAIN